MTELLPTPTATPISNRPSLMWPTIAASSEIRDGFPSGGTWTARPTLTRYVRAAMALATVGGADMNARPA